MPVTKYADRIILLEERMRKVELDFGSIERLLPHEKSQATKLECIRLAGYHNMKGRKALKWAKKFFSWVTV